MEYFGIWKTQSTLSTGYKGRNLRALRKLLRTILKGSGGGKWSIEDDEGKIVAEGTVRS